jgi:Sister chromatid cohesion protein Dcc1
MDDLLSSATKASPLLLSIPQSELGSCSSSSFNGLISSSSDLKKKTKKKTSQLLLLQLPIGYRSPRHVRSFVGREHAACIVADQSYSVHRVETSNTLLIIPPPPKHMRSVAADNCPDGDDRPTHKRIKRAVVTTTTHHDAASLELPNAATSTTTTTAVMVHRLGGSGNVSSSSSFLELRRKYLNVAEVISALPVWDPFLDDKDQNNETVPEKATTKPLDEMAIELQASERELRTFLDTVLDRAVAFGVGGSSYALMTEQVQQICSTAIVATLAEDNDACSSEAKDPVALQTLVDKSVQRIISTERFPNMALAIHHVVRKSFAAQGSVVPVHDGTKVILDWTKVRSVLSRLHTRLFSFCLSHTYPFWSC